MKRAIETTATMAATTMYAPRRYRGVLSVAVNTARMTPPTDRNASPTMTGFIPDIVPSTMIDWKPIINIAELHRTARMVYPAVRTGTVCPLRSRTLRCRARRSATVSKPATSRDPRKVNAGQSTLSGSPGKTKGPVIPSGRSPGPVTSPCISGVTVTVYASIPATRGAVS